MKNLLSLIQDFDNSHLSVKEIFDRQKFIFDEIHASLHLVMLHCQMVRL
jgi:hypothetical protein